MATIQRYVNTASSGGDGTTNGTAGGTAAFASLSAAIAAISPGASDDVIIDCCGASTDAASVNIAFGTAPASILIRGNRSDPAGFYSGNLTISTSHYRIEAAGAVSQITVSEANTTIDGIQIIAGGGANRAAIVPASPGCTVRKCRMLGNGCDFGLGQNSDWVVGGTYRFENNLIVGFNVEQIALRVAIHTSPTVHCYNNTLYGEGSSIGIKLSQFDGSGSGTYNIKGNASANSGSGSDYDASGFAEAGATVNLDNNAFAEAAGTSGEIALGTPSSAWTSPGTGASNDFSIKDTNSSLYNAVNPVLVATDINDVARGGSDHDVGAFAIGAIVPAPTLRVVRGGLQWR
jgi:hypothetical protein